MTGGLIQLVATGAQDEYLTKDSDITFFKTKFKKHTNFSVEPITQNFNSGSGFGRKVECVINKNADLLSSMYLIIKLPKLINKNDDSNNQLSYVNSIGHAIIEEIYVEIGGKVIDKHTGEWLNIWSELTLDSSKKRGYNDKKIVGNLLCSYNLLSISLFVSYS